MPPAGSVVVGGAGGGTPGAATEDTAVWVVTGDKLLQTYPTSGQTYTPMDVGDTIRMQKRVKTAGDYTVSINYAMASASANAVKLECDYKSVADGADPDAALGSATPATSEFTPGNDTNMHQHETFVVTVANDGDNLVILLTRVAPAAAAHPGLLNFIDPALDPVP